MTTCLPCTTTHRDDLYVAVQSLCVKLRASALMSLGIQQFLGPVQGHCGAMMQDAYYCCSLHLQAEI